MNRQWMPAFLRDSMCGAVHVVLKGFFPGTSVTAAWQRVKWHVVRVLAGYITASVLTVHALSMAVLSYHASSQPSLLQKHIADSRAWMPQLVVERCRYVARLCDVQICCTWRLPKHVSYTARAGRQASGQLVNVLRICIFAVKCHVVPGIDGNDSLARSAGFLPHMVLPQ